MCGIRGAGVLSGVVCVMCFVCPSIAATAEGSTGFIQLPWDRFELVVERNEKHDTFHGSGGKCAVPAG